MLDKGKTSYRVNNFDYDREYFVYIVSQSRGVDSSSSNVIALSTGNFYYFLI